VPCREHTSKALRYGKVFRIGTVRYNWPMSAHASQAFSIAHCTDSEDLPRYGTRSQRISQFYLHTPRTSANHTCPPS